MIETKKCDYTPSDFSCGDCRKNFKNRKTWMQHLRNVHLNKKEEKFVCICEENHCRAKKEKIIFTGEYKYCPYCGHNMILKKLEEVI